MLLNEIFTVLCLLASSPCKSMHRFFPHILRQFCVPQTTLNSPYSPYALKHFPCILLIRLRSKNTWREIFFFFFLNFVCVGRVLDPTPLFLWTSFLYLNLVAMGPVHLSPVTWPQALRYWYSLTPLMHTVAQLRPIDLHNFLGQIPESSQLLGASKLPLLE